VRPVLRWRGCNNLTQDRSIPMTEQAISPLRRRMIEDMAIRKFAMKTQHDYVQRVKDFAAFLGRSPQRAESEDVRRFRLHLTSSGAGTPKINATVAALRFLFKGTLDRPELAKHLAFMHEPRKVPVILSPEEVARFLEAAPGIKYKAALSVAYGAGLRVSEVVSLKVSDIDSKRMMLRVEQGKGRKDRHAMLSPLLLELLRDWYRIGRPQGWLFPGQNPTNPMTTRQLTRACNAAAQMADITKRVTPHTLRHYVAFRTMSRTFCSGPAFWRKSPLGRDIVSPLLSTCAGERVYREVYRQRSGGSVTRAGWTSGALYCLVFKVGNRTGIRAVFAAEADLDRCQF
jgi:integrase/recombinase XerD